MSNKSKPQWGVTSAISMAHPEPHELVQNEALLAELKAQNTFEKPEETEHRIAILAHLQNVVEKFVLEVGRSKKDQLDQSIIENGGGKVLTFGGFRLGVYGPGKPFPLTLILPPKLFPSDQLPQTPISTPSSSAPSTSPGTTSSTSSPRS